MKYFSIVAGLIWLASISACGPSQLSGPGQPATASDTRIATSPPTATETAIPTNTPTASLTPTDTPVPTGPCDNPLIPLGTGNRWVYRVTSPGGGGSFSITSEEIQQGANTVAMVTYSNQKNNYTVTNPVTCQDGAIVNFPLFVINMLFSPYLDKYIPAAHLSGDYAPNFQALTQNNWVLNWQARYLTEEAVSLKDPRGLADLYIPANTQMDLAFILNNLREAVISPEGNFPQALKITQTLSLPVPGSVLYIGIGEWYEPYIGLVRAEINAVLLGKERLPITSTLELVEFTNGK